jgi:hypothetical protein
VHSPNPDIAVISRLFRANQKQRPPRDLPRVQDDRVRDTPREFRSLALKPRSPNARTFTEASDSGHVSAETPVNQKRTLARRRRFAPGWREKM